MKNFIKLLIIICCLGFSPCYTEARDTTEIDSTPQYKEYFEDYAKRLYKNYFPEKHFFFGQGNLFMFFINRDGTIENLDTFFKDNRFSRYGKKLILNTPAYPFPEQIKDDKIFVAISMLYAYYDSAEVDLRGRTETEDSLYWKRFYDKPSINVVDIHIEKDCHKK